MWNAGSRWGKKKWKQLQGRDVFFSVEKKESCLIRIYVQQTRQRGVAGWCECGSPTLPSSLGLSLRWTTGPGWVFVDLQQRGGGVKGNEAGRMKNENEVRILFCCCQLQLAAPAHRTRNHTVARQDLQCRWFFFPFFVYFFFFCNSACWGVATQQRKTNTNPLSC